MKKLQKICLIAGIALLAVAAVVLIAWQWGIHSANEKAAYYVQSIQALTPQAQSAVPEPRRDNTMPVLSIDGTDFAGVIEMPRFGSALPVGAQWGKVSKYPCLFDGSAYDSTLQIGASSQAGQYDFYRDISVGDSVFFTDMAGNRFSYRVTDICYEKHADQATLQKADANLTLFIQNIYAFEYIVISCDISK